MRTTGWLFIILVGTLAAPALADDTPSTSPATSTAPPATAPSIGPTPIASADDVRKMVDDGKYRDAVKSLVRILDLKGAAATGYDRSEMFLLRAECELQLRE
ncbi:MAG TPA: hypothetical protein VGN88_06325, partial [Phycisphaerae bacterium]